MFSSCRRHFLNKLWGRERYGTYSRNKWAETTRKNQVYFNLLIATRGERLRSVDPCDQGGLGSCGRPIRPACFPEMWRQSSREVQVGRSPKYETRRYRAKQQPASKAWIKDLGPWPLKGIGYQQVVWKDGLPQHRAVLCSPDLDRYCCAEAISYGGFWGWNQIEHKKCESSSLPKNDERRGGWWQRDGGDDIWDENEIEHKNNFLPKNDE